MDTRTYVARLPYNQYVIPYRCQNQVQRRLGELVALPIRSFDGAEAPAVLRYSAGSVQEGDGLEFRLLDGRLFLPMRAHRRVGDGLVMDVAREEDLPRLFGEAKADALDNPLLRRDLHFRDGDKLETIEDVQARDLAKGERARWGSSDLDKTRTHAFMQAEALVLIDGVVHHRTAEPVWVVDGPKVSAVLGRHYDTDRWHGVGDIRHMGFPEKGTEAREAFCRHLGADMAPKKQFFRADRFDDALAYAAEFGTPEVSGSVDVLGDAPLHLPEFAHFAAKLVQRLERELNAEDFRSFGRGRLMIYADLRDAVALLGQGDRSALDPAVDAMRRLVHGIPVDPEAKPLSRYARWVVPYRAFVRRWECETARPDFDLYPEQSVAEEAVPDLPAPGFAA